MSAMTLQRLSLGGACVPALLAGLLLAGSAPAAAQSASATVVCVGSELTPESSNPVPRVITEDVTVTYRIGVADADRETMERTLLAELGDREEVSCLWSTPGDSHVAIMPRRVRRGDGCVPDEHETGAPWEQRKAGHGHLVSVWSWIPSSTTGPGRPLDYLIANYRSRPRIRRARTGSWPDARTEDHRVPPMG